MGGIGRTGNATDIDVASNAAMSVIIHKLPKAARNRHPGLNTAGDGTVVLLGFSASSNGSGTGEGEGEGERGVGSVESATLSSPKDCDEGVAMVSVSVSYRIVVTQHDARKRRWFYIFDDKVDTRLK